MADSAAVRNKRARQHKLGDHSLCRPENCPARAAYLARSQAPATVAPAVAGPAAVGDDGRVPGGIESAVVAFVEALPYRVPDPRALLAQIAVRLAQRVDETGALPAAVRELRVLLVQLTENPNGAPGVVDEVRLQAAQRKLDVILSRVA